MGAVCLGSKSAFLTKSGLNFFWSAKIKSVSIQVTVAISDDEAVNESVNKITLDATQHLRMEKL
jgi:hypothetical protein